MGSLRRSTIITSGYSLFDRHTEHPRVRGTLPLEETDVRWVTVLVDRRIFTQLRSASPGAERSEGLGASHALSFAATSGPQAGDQLREIGRLSIVVNGHILTPHLRHC